MSLLTIVEASKQFKVGRTTIYKAIKRGDLTPQKIMMVYKLLMPRT